MQTNKRIKILESKKKKQIMQLSKNQDIIIGSLVYLKRRCGTEKKYGAYFLSRYDKGRTSLIYIPKDKVKEIRKKTERYKRLKEAIRQISKINIEILKHRRK